MSKGRYDLALECAKRAVNSAPSEFTTWERLAQVYLKREQWEDALLTLNSCPMFTYQDRDLPKMPVPAKMHLPVLQEAVLEEEGDERDTVDPTLAKLPAAGLKGTFKKAYRILTEITSQIGWDQLLKCRSGVFVMEEEYRHEKSASVVGVRGSMGDEEGESDAEGEEGEKEKAVVNGDAKEEVKENGEKTPEEGEVKAAVDGETKETPEIIEKPELTVLPEEAKASHEDSATLDSAKSTPAEKSFLNKRLCERWLDNLFMVLYEDLRIYTIWRSDIVRYTQQKKQYHKSATEWEILGELAQRLHHHEEAEEAFQACLQMKFSPGALRGILQAQERVRDNRGSLDSIIRLTAWQYRWYSEVSHVSRGERGLFVGV